MNLRPDPGFESGWRRRFERYAASHDDDAGIAGWSASGLEARFQFFVNLWQSQPCAATQGHWLDAGCGAGTYTRYLAQQGLQVTAVDYSELSVNKARNRAPDAVRWAVADVTRLPLRDASVDGALCFGVMQALESPERALAELRRVLRPGGALWVDALNAHCLPTLRSEVLRRWRRWPPHLRYDRAGPFEGSLRVSGFDRISMHWVPILPRRLRLLRPLFGSRAGHGLMRVPPLGRLAGHSFLAVARAG